VISAYTRGPLERVGRCCCSH